MSDEQRLYGLPGAEQMYFDPASVYEAEIDPWMEEGDGSPWEIEEWTCVPAADHLPAAWWLIEQIVEYTVEEGILDEVGADDFAAAAAHTDVVAAVEAVRRLLASKVKYRMAKKLVATHTVTWDKQGEPLYDGQAMYGKATQ